MDNYVWIPPPQFGNRYIMPNLIKLYYTIRQIFMIHKYSVAMINTDFLYLSRFV